MPSVPVAGQVFNIGGLEEISINALAQRVIALAQSSSTIRHISYEMAYGQKFDDMMRRVPKLDKILRRHRVQPAQRPRSDHSVGY